MKAFIIPICILTALSSSCLSQITIGPRAGANITDVKELDLPFSGSNNFFNPKFSYHIGGFVKIPASEKIFILGEIVYSRKGSRLRDLSGNRLNFRLDYLTLPLLIGIQINDWSVLFGTEFAFNVGKNRLNSIVDIGIVGGVKYYIPEKVQLGLRFVQGLSALNNFGPTDGGGVTGLNRLRNQTWQLSVSLDISQF